VLAQPRAIHLDEEDRLKLLDLRTEQESLEMYIAGGNCKSSSLLYSYKSVLKEINEFKREKLLEMDELDEGMYDYVFYFDTVAGFVVIEDDES
jgi:hypothetical protein